MEHERRLGLITGPIVLDDDSGSHDLRKSVWPGPRMGITGRVTVAHHEANHLLVVEKGAIFDRLREQEFPQRHRCILACGVGYPSRAFHLLLRGLHDQLRLPFLVLADNDPGGYELFFLLARGNAGNRGERRPALAIPDAAYLGLRARDYESLGLNDWVTIELSGAEKAQVERLRSCPWLRHEDAWQRELEALAAHGFKIEMEALASMSRSYLAEIYLPPRLSASDHLRLTAGH